MIIQTDKPLRERDPHDFYPTPIEVCRAALNILPDSLAPRRALDPGAGTGVWGMAAYEKWPGILTEGVELDDRHIRPPCYYYWSSCDFLSDKFIKPGYQYDIAFGNPPYKEAEKFIRKSWSLLKDGGHLVFLLRLAFLEGQARARGLWKEIKPDAVYVLAARPSFMPEGHEKAGKTDATAYGIFHFIKPTTGYPREHGTQLGWLDWKQTRVKKIKEQREGDLANPRMLQEQIEGPVNPTEGKI